MGGEAKVECPHCGRKPGGHHLDTCPRYREPRKRIVRGTTKPAPKVIQVDRPSKHRKAKLQRGDRSRRIRKARKAHRLHARRSRQ